MPVTESDGLIVGMYGEEATEYDMESLPSDFDMSAMKARLDDILVATLVYNANQRFPWITERTAMTITTVGYGDVAAVMPAEQVTALLSMEEIKTTTALPIP